MSISDRISALSPAQRELLETLRRKSAAQRPAPLGGPPPIARRPPGDAWPLSLDQERLWFLFQLDPADTSYNLPTATRLSGRLDAAALSRALDEIVRRHEAWRTSFPALDGRPVQVVAPPAPVPLPRVDLTGLPEDAREREALRVEREQGRLPFDLTQGPLVRALLVRLAPNRHDFVLTVHHIVTDWYSYVVFWGELGKLYPTLAAGWPANLPELPVQYADFSVWQREQLSGPVLQTHLDYWLEHLEGAPLALELPTDRPRPAHFTTRGGQIPLRLTRAQSDGLKALSQQERVTPFMVLLALFQTLLSRWSGQDRVLVSAPNANRHREELQQLLGFFVTQLVFATDLGGNPTFRELLGRVRQVALGAYAHQDLPFGKLVEALRPERDTSRPPIAQVDLIVLETGEKDTPFGDLTATAIDVDSGTSAFELTLALWDSPTGHHGYLEYNTDLFDPATAGRLAAGFLSLFDATLARVDAPLSALPVQGESAVQALLRWNDTGAPPPEGLLHTRFFAQAERTPEAVAVVDGRERQTYGELAARAADLAAHLRRLGVGPETRVAVCLPRSADLVVALLGVLEAGGAYVPVDPVYPEDRQRFMLQDSGARLALHPGLKPGAMNGCPNGTENAAPIAIDTLCPAGTAISSPRFQPGALPGNLAYLIYTSGSTGRPKAVGIEHRSAAAFVEWAAESFGEDLAAGVLASTSVCFDLSIFEIFGPLSCGGTLVMAENALALAELPAAGEVRLINTVPSALTELLRLGGLPPSVRTVNLAGEPLTRRLADELHRLAPAARLFNLYGPSEDTTYSTWAEVPPGVDPTIGRPVRGTRVHLLDRELRPVPLGGRGELFLAGAGLARGYLGRPELTAERFVPDPFAARPGERLYRTGDLARWRTHGELEFLGRADRQVKVRGFRVEPAEIEALLRAHPDVADAAVAVRDGRLVAWIVPRNGATPDLRGALLERLPRHMVPALWSTLPALPLTPNGKVDYRALPDPDAPAAGDGAPRTPAEERLAAVWAEVLGLPRVGVHDNFFRLGGDSILSIRVVARARQAGLALTPRQIFERQTVAELAAVATPLDSAMVAENAGPVTGTAPLTPIQRWFLDADPVDPHHYNQAVLLEARGPVEDAELRRTVATLLEHHDALRLRFGPEGAVFTPPPAEPPVTRIDFSALPAERHRAALEETAARVHDSLDLVRGPLLRAVFFDLGTGRSGRLLLVLHHLVVDGVSWRILLEDLQTAQQALPLPPKTTSWKRWAERLAEHARSAAVQAEADFWLAQPEPEPLPVDLSGGDDTEASAGLVSVALPAEATRALLRNAPAAWRTRLDDLLLTALARAFAAWTGSPRLVVWLEGHGRGEPFPDVDLSRTVGWFTALFPVALDLQGAEGPGAAIRQVKETLRSLPDKGIGYGLLRWLRGAERSKDLSGRRDPEVVFNYLGQLDLVLPEEGRYAPAAESAGWPRSPRAPRRHRLEINAGVVGGQLEVHWGYGRNVYERATIEALAQRFLTELEALIEHCLAPGAGGWTPSDFPLAQLGQETLDRLLGGDPAVEDVYPLSPMQAGLLFHGLYAPSTEIYFEQITCTIRGDLDAAAFHRAWQRLVDRHGILRTAFVWEGLDEPLQVVRRGVELPWLEEDWRGTADPDARLAAFAAADRRRAFDLRRAPLLRASLLRTAEREHRFVWSFHHLLLDGWSLPPLFAEVFALYRDEPLPAPALPYRDFVAWLGRRDHAADESYWRQALSGIAGPTPLPWDSSAPPSERADEFVLHEVVLPETATDALEGFARQRGLTLNTVVQGAWGLLLSRWSGEREVIFGAVAAGRPPELPGFETALGLFINTLPVRLDTAPERPLAGWLAALQSAQIEARQHEQAPLAEVQRWSGVPASEPLFQSLLIFENYPLDAGVADRTSGLQLADVQAVERTNYPLTLAVVPGSSLRLQLTADRRLERVTGQRLVGWLERLLEAFVVSPERPLDRFDPLSEAERQQILVEWNDTGALRPGDLLHSRFFAWASRTPEAVAVIDGHDRRTYGEIAARASALAEQLRQSGIGPEDRVAVALPRSADLVAALLGVLEAGAAYVPIDPAYPEDRRRFMLEDSGARLALTPETLTPGPSPASGRGVNNPESSNLAYLIYTSGSTGRPKAVGIEHRSAAAFIQWAAESFAEDLAGSVLASTSVCFDLSIFEIFGPLSCGGTVVMAENALALPELPAAGEVRLINTVPSALTELLRLGGLPPSVRTVNLAGEPLSRRLAGELHRIAPAARLFNLYGPSEDTTYSTWAQVPPEVEPTIGRPVRGTRVHLLDREMRPVPLGGRGELFLAGAGLARGYLGRPDLTAERFVPDPFTTEPGERLYRTGDLARWRMDGSLDFLGRADRQVKVHGFRIELGEIETLLRAHPDVADAAVAVRDGRLAAWVVPRAGAAPDLRSALLERLPRHMVPALWSTLPALPLTPNGKVDYRSLPDPDTPVMGGGAPRTPAEERLATIWAEVLGLPRVGIHDNFFRLGGDSILSIRVVARAQQAGLALTPRQIFERQTVAELAAVATALDGAAVAVAPEDIGPVTGIAPLTPIQRWFLDTDPVDPHHFNQAVLLETQGPVEDAELRRAVATLLEHHDALRLRFGPEGAVFTPPPAEPPVIRIDLAVLPADLHRAALEAAASQVHASLDLVQGPLLRAAFFDLGADLAGRLLLVIHHLVVDGVSWRILLEDLQTVQHALPLPPKTTSWKRWAERLAEHAQSETIQAEAGFWLAQPEPEPLPVDLSGGDDTEASAGLVSVALPAEATRALLREAHTAWRTRPDDLLLTALSRAFAAWTGSPRLVLSLEGHGREDLFPGVDLSRTVGWFTSLYPVALDLEGVEEPGAAIRQVKETLRSIPEKGIGYGLLRWPNPERSNNLPPKRDPEVVFNYLGQLDLVLPEGSRYAPAAEPSGWPRSPRAPRRHRLEINAGVVGGRLEVHWGYGRNVHERATIEALAQWFLAELEALIEACLAPGAGGWTPSDFPLARLGQQPLDRLVGGDPAIEDLYPLSPMQAGLLFHGLYAPSTEIYFEQTTCTIRGDLDTAAFRRAWQRLVDRHGILRTAFAWEGLDEPLQVVRRGIELPWLEEDWRGTEDPDARLAAFAAADRRQGFDLRRAPLLRAALLRTGEREHRFVWSFHHLLLDGWSLPPLFAEVFALYQAPNQEDPLPAPALPYRDFGAWLARRDRGADERYWRQALAGLTGPTQLPWDHPAASSERADEFAQHEVLLSAPDTAALEGFARERGLTLNTLVQGAWGLLLSRWSGEREVVFGAVAAGRPPELAGFETALGLFINTLPVRLDADPERPLADWLTALQSAQIEARQHEQAPLAEVQRWSGVPSRERLFHSLLVFENYPLDTTVADGAGGLELADVRTVERTSYPLSLAVIPGSRLRLRLTQDRHLEPVTGQRLLGWLGRLLDGFVAAPERPLDRFDPLSNAERHQLLAEWNDTAVPPLPEQRLDRLFRLQAERTPDAAALRFRDETLSFREMAARVDRLAMRLRVQGVGPDVPVVLLLDRGLDLPLAAFAVLAAGGAFVPLDPRAPAERLSRQIEDCGAPLVIDREWMEAAAADPASFASLPEVEGSPDDLAYIIFTSGSTGTPKGTLIRHRSVANLVLALRRAVYGETEGLRVALNASMAFDGAIKQLIQVVSGHCLDLLPEEVRLDPGRLPAYLEEHAVDAMDVTPSQLRILLAEGALARSRQVPGRVLVGGEALDGATWEALAADPRTGFFNVYGPTECTVDTTASRIVPGEPPHAGRPLANMATYLLDPEGRLSPPGAVGQLFIGGAGLARGYLGRPDLTAAVFVPDPFSGVPGARLYASGDLGRFLPDGRLQLHGRADRQVKIRGYRIEPGEIEAVLRRHSEVREVAVVVHGDAEPRLVAWVVPAPGSRIQPSALRSWLLGQLPDPMVPAEIGLLDELPRTISGKIDRRALADRTPEAAEERPFEAPANEAEETLAGLWRELLRVERVGRNDNFFDLGGHSLLATQLMVRIRDRFGVEVPLPDLFEAENLAAQARGIVALRLRVEDPHQLKDLMAELDGLSDEEVEALLAESEDDEA